MRESCCKYFDHSRLGIPFFRMTGDEWEEEARQAQELGPW
jgi:hypothetical protein